MGKIISVKHFEIHDGDGIRTTLFLKGCPLNCKWCHNPESKSSKPEISYLAKKCINCLECVQICSCHTEENGYHFFERSGCVGCGKCETVCLGDAIKFYGKEITAEEILPELLADKPFFDTSKGGVTVSGGEPLMQADFTLEILKLLKQNGINTAVDTCGFADWKAFEKIIPYTDKFLYDIKAFNGEVHKKCTGVDNKIILENLKRIDKENIPVEIRIPFVPGMNDCEIKPIGTFLKELNNITKIKVLPYHNLAASKYQSLGLEYAAGDVVPPDKSQINSAVEILTTMNLPAINGMPE